MSDIWSNALMSFGVAVVVLVLDFLGRLVVQATAISRFQPVGERFDRRLATGIPNVVGFSAIFVGLGFDALIALSCDQLSSISSPIREWGSQWVIVAALLSGAVLAILGILTLFLVWKDEIALRLGYLHRRLGGGKITDADDKALNGAVMRRKRFIIAVLGFASIVIPAFLVFASW